VYSFISANPVRLAHVDVTLYNPRQTNRISLELSIAQNNIWTREHTFSNAETCRLFTYGFDGEITEQRFLVSYRPVSRLTFSFCSSIFIISGGFMDPGIETFHNALGIRDHQRPLAKKNQVNINLNNSALLTQPFVINSVPRLKTSYTLIRKRFVSADTFISLLPLTGGIDRRVTLSPEGAIGIDSIFGFNRFQLVSSVAAMYLGFSNYSRHALTVNPWQAGFIFAAILKIGVSTSFQFTTKYLSAMYTREAWYIAGSSQLTSNEYVSSGLPALFDSTKWFALSLCHRSRSPAPSFMIFINEDSGIRKIRPLAMEANDSPDLGVGLTLFIEK